jgi:hypothetical protein
MITTFCLCFWSIFCVSYDANHKELIKIATEKHQSCARFFANVLICATSWVSFQLQIPPLVPQWDFLIAERAGMSYSKTSKQIIGGRRLLHGLDAVPLESLHGSWKLVALRRLPDCAFGIYTKILRRGRCVFLCVRCCCFVYTVGRKCKK